MHSSLDNVLPDVAFRRLSVASAFIFDVDRTLADPHERMEEGILSEWWTRSNPVPMIRDLALHLWNRGPGVTPYQLSTQHCLCLLIPG